MSEDSRIASHAIRLLVRLRKHIKSCNIITPHGPCEIDQLQKEVDSFLKQNQGKIRAPQMEKPRSEPLRTFVNGISSEAGGEPCSVCFKSTNRWYKVKDVALCRRCSYYAPLSAIPNKKDWFALVKERQAIKRKNHLGENVD